MIYRADATDMVSPAQIAGGGASYLEKAEDIIFDLTNEMRKQNGLPKLKKDDILRETSRQHSADMLARNFFSHGNPDGLGSDDRIHITHRTLIGLTGENISTNSGYDVHNAREQAEFIVDGWMNSPGHRANILDDEYTHLGVGVATDGYKVMATQNFSYVLAYLKDPLPESVRRGASLDLDAKAMTPKGKPVKFVFITYDSEKRVAGPFPIENAKADVRHGLYKLQFYFDVGPHYELYVGPQIEVR